MKKGSNFPTKRKPDTDVIPKMSYENFIEMQYDVGHEEFRQKKQLEYDLEQFYADLFRSRYSRVSSTREPYAVNYEQGIHNEVVLKKLLNLNQPIQTLDKNKIKELILM